MNTLRTTSDAQLLQELKTRLAGVVKQEILLEQIIALNKKLENSERLKSHFLSNIKNEINNPLAGILALSQQVATQEQDLQQLRKNVAYIYQEAFHLNFQMTNIIMAAEIEAGEAVPDMLYGDFVPVVTSTLKSFQHAIDKKLLTTAYHLPEQLTLTSDFRFLQIILANLISNAIKFNKQDGSLELCVDVQEDKIILKVADQGHGIPQQDYHKIFDRFCQLESGTGKLYTGHGLGLAVSKSLIELLSGEMHCESSSAGSTFIITIPLGIDSSAGTFAEDAEIFFKADEEF